MVNICPYGGISAGRMKKDLVALSCYGCIRALKLRHRNPSPSFLSRLNSARAFSDSTAAFGKVPYSGRDSAFDSATSAAAAFADLLLSVLISKISVI